VERELRALAQKTAENQKPHRRGSLRGIGLENLRERGKIGRAELSLTENYAEQKAEVAHPVGDERLFRRLARGVRIGIVGD